MRPLRFAVLGRGVIAGLHQRVLGELPGVAEFAASAGRGEVAGVLADPAVDAVVVCTPSGTHAELGEAALRAGKHVLVEKPIEVSLAAADRLIETARQTGRTLGVVSQHRFDPATVTVKAAIDSGELGSITSVLVEVPWWRGQSYYRSGSWRGTRALDGGGALINQAIHALDLAQWLAGPIVETRAHCGWLAHPQIEVEDVATASLRFESGALGALLATTAAYPGRTARVAVHGDQGSAVIDNDELAYFHSAAAAGPAESAYGAYGAGNQAAQRLPQLGEPAARDEIGLLRQPHRDQLTDFCAAVAQGRPPLVDGQAGRQALAAVLAVYESANAGSLR